VEGGVRGVYAGVQGHHGRRAPLVSLPPTQQQYVCRILYNKSNVLTEHVKWHQMLLQNAAKHVKPALRDMHSDVM